MLALPASVSALVNESALLTFGNPDHAAGNACSRVASWLRFKVVRFRVNHG